MTHLTQILVNLPLFVSILLKITVVLGAGWILHILLGKCSPRWRVLLWRGVIAGVVLVPILVPLRYLQISISPALETAVPSQTLVEAELPAIDTSDGSPMGFVADLPPQSESISHSSFSISIWARENLWAIILFGWGLVAVLMTARFFTVFTKIRKSVNSSLPAPKHLRHLLDEVAADLNCPQEIDLRYSSDFTTPFLAGLRKPIIVLPERMIDGKYTAELPAIYAHEVAHLRSRDLLWMFAARWLGVVMWFHPLVWKLREAHNAACEEVCDAVAADYVGNAESYSGTLARIALEIVGKVPAVGGIPMARCSEIIGRLRILKRKIYSLPLARHWVILSLLIGFVALASLGGLSLVYAEAASGDEDLARHLLHKMQEGREKVKNFKCVAVHHQYDSQKAREELAEALRRMGRSGGMGGTIPELAEKYEYTFREIRLALDNECRGRLERLEGESDAEGNVISKNERSIYTWDGRKGIDYTDNLRDEWPGAAMISKEQPFQISNRFWQPLAMFGGNFCDALATAVKEGSKIDIGREKGGTYRVVIAGEDDSEQVGVVDPDQGHSVTVQEGYQGGALLSQYKAKFQGVSPGVWFPVEAECVWFLSSDPNVLRSKSTVKVTDVVINDPLFYEGLFDVDIPKGTQVRDFTEDPDRPDIYVYGKPRKNYEQIVQGEGKFIAGVVSDQNGIAVSDVHVQVCCLKTPRGEGKFMWTYSGGHDVLNARTDNQGRFAIELEQDGVYNLRSSSKNHAAVIIYDIGIGKRDLKVTVPQGGTIIGRVVRIENGQKVPVASAEVKAEQSSRSSYSHLGFGRDRKTVTDSQGNFRFDHLRTKMRSIETGALKEWEYTPRFWKISCAKTSRTIAFHEDSKIENVELVMEPDLTAVAPLIGKPLPKFEGIKIEFRADQAKGKEILVCFWDMNQRPSRHMVRGLAKRAKELKEEGVIVVGVQASKVDRKELDEWVKKYNIPFPVGTIEGDEEKTRFSWGVKSLPWLILTDREHVVTAEGFALNELNERIKEGSGS